MKKGLLAPGLAALLAAGCASDGASKDMRTEWGDDPMGNPEYMQAFMEYMTPGEEHAELAKGTGQWKVACNTYFEPDAEPLPMKAKARCKMLLGDRFLMEEFSGSMMGQPFEGLLILGYNKLSGEYESVWLSNWGTGFSLSSGPAHDNGDIEMQGLMKDVLTPEGRPYRHVSKQIGPDEFMVEMYDTLPDGTEWMVMELHYTRM